MKNTGVCVILFCLLSFSFELKANDYPSLLTNTAIPPNKIISRTRKTPELFSNSAKLLSTFVAIERKEGSLPSEWLSNANSTVKKLTSLLNQNQSDEAALTIRLYIGVIKIGTSDQFFKISKGNSWILVLENGTEILNSISQNHPNSWQGKVAFFFGMKEQYPDPHYNPPSPIQRSKILKKQIDALLSISNQNDREEFQKFKLSLGPETDWLEQGWATLINHEIRNNNFIEAEQEITKFKESGLAKSSLIMSLRKKLNLAQNK